MIDKTFIEEAIKGMPEEEEIIIKFSKLIFPKPYWGEQKTEKIIRIIVGNPLPDGLFLKKAEGGAKPKKFGYAEMISPELLSKTGLLEEIEIRDRKIESLGTPTINLQRLTS